jgi:tRNA(fMet)-specific endonuclease VapC
MLDTNSVSALISKRSRPVRDRLDRAGLTDTSTSSLVYGEVRYGLIKNPEATRLAAAATKFFAEIDILPWTMETAEVYGVLRARMRRLGKALQPLDMLIAAHALEAGATLVTNDRAFRHVPGLAIEDWTAE